MTDGRKFGRRLVEERKRAGLNQPEFAALGGVKVGSQNRYEADKQVPSAEYLARLADHDVDVFYVLTGRRYEGDWLDAGATELLGVYMGLPQDLRSALRLFARSMGNHFLNAPEPEDAG